MTAGLKVFVQSVCISVIASMQVKARQFATSSKLALMMKYKGDYYDSMVTTTLA